MSNIYAAGVEATAITNITSAVNARISFDSEGRKVLDVASLKAWLETEFASLTAEAVAPADAASVAAAAAAVSTATMAEGLNNAIRPERFTSRPDWPTSTSAITGANMATAVKSLMAECKRLSDRLSNYYADLDSRLGDLLTKYYFEAGIDNLVPKGVQRVIESRAVIYTYVTDRDEESAPSPVSELFEVDQNDTATYTAASPPSGRNVTKVRWYRSNSSNAGASFQFADEQAIAGGLDYEDEKKNAELEEPCPTITWEEPPVNLQGLIATANGGMGGFYGNTWCYCENYVPYAWPTEYRHTSPWPIVGAGSIDDLEVVLTRGRPMFLAGADSASKQRLDIDSDQACVSRRSIVVGPGGVYFASPDGICRANRNGVALITGPGFFDLFGREWWQARAPSTIFAAINENCYIFWTNSGTVCYSLNLVTGKLVSITRAATAVYQDLIADRTYVAYGTTILELFSATTNRTARWKGKRAVFPQKANLAFMQVHSDFASTLSGKLYRDGTLSVTMNFSTSKAKKIAPKSVFEHEVELTGSADVTAITVASSAQELRQV